MASWVRHHRVSKAMPLERVELHRQLVVVEVEVEIQETMIFKLG